MEIVYVALLRLACAASWLTRSIRRLLEGDLPHNRRQAPEPPCPSFPIPCCPILYATPALQTTLIPTPNTYPHSAVTAAGCQVPAAGLNAERYALVCAAGAAAHAVQHLASGADVPAVYLVILPCTCVQEVAIWREGDLWGQRKAGMRQQRKCAEQHSNHCREAELRYNV